MNQPDLSQLSQPYGAPDGPVQPEELSGVPLFVRQPPAPGLGVLRSIVLVLMVLVATADGILLLRILLANLFTQTVV